MKLEPFEIKGKTISDCYENGDELIIEFTDGTKIRIVVYLLNEINGNENFLLPEIYPA